MSQPDVVNFYRDIIPDIAAFEAAVARPLPQTFWLNPLRVTQQLAMPHTQPLSWYSNAYSYTGDESLGHSWMYKIGLLQIQEAVSMLPVRLLDPQPHETVLDLCAAPGNKTAEMAVAMQNTGTLIANDRNYQRMKALGQIMRRLGLCNISMTVQDALNYQTFPEFFDRILVDAPCSCEGTLRKRVKKRVIPNPKQHRHLASRQIAILKKAIQLCKPGGRIVYSTCTFSPVENEGVISSILNHFGNQVRIVPPQLPNFTWSSGVTEWQGVDYHPDVVQTMRVWPHQNDTGGFYVAVLEKYSGDPAVEPVTTSQLTTSETARPYLDELVERFGFSNDLLSQYPIDQASNRGLYLVNQDHQVPEALSKDVSGLLFLKTRTNYPKLATGAAMLLGRYAKKNTVALNSQQFEAYLSREECELTVDQQASCTDTGFVIVMYRGYVAGLGLYLSPHYDKPGRLQSLFPKSI